MAGMDGVAAFRGIDEAESPTWCLIRFAGLISNNPIQNQIVKIVKVKKLNCSFYNIKKSCKKMFSGFFLEQP